MTETTPACSVNQHGFTIYDEFIDTYGDHVWVQESNVTTEPKVWIFCDSEGEAAHAHLGIAHAERVRDALDAFIRETKETLQAESLAAAETETDERAESIKDLAWMLENALLRDAAMTQQCTWPDEWEAAQLLAKARRTVKAHKELRDAILAEPHHRWPGVSACLKATFPDEECACGRDVRVERLLSIMAGIYEETA